nr:hypothetical protein [Enterobacter roggenkampii]
MGITSAGLQTRNVGCGNQMRARTAALNERKTMVHYLVSPPRPPLLKRTPSQSYKFTALPGWKWRHDEVIERLFYMSRAPRFIPRRGLKSKTKMRVLPAPSGIFASSNFN